MYQARRHADNRFVPLRHLRYHVRTWGTPQPGVPPLVLVHGWMDVGASWQFVVDAMAEDRFVIAPDWRGFGLTEVPPTDQFWHADYLADLDFLLDALVPEGPVDLAGHSMGGNVAMLYAGVRPQRIRRLINLEGFGMPAMRADKAPQRHAQWIDELKALERGDKALKHYADVDGVARRLMRTNPRLTPDKAAWLAQHWARPVTLADGSTQWQILGHAAHKVIGAQVYRVEEALAHFAAITAPVLVLEASDNEMERWWGGRYMLAEFHERLRAVPDCRRALVTDAAHMLHHDQPAQVAKLIEDFLR
ncbi:alpha/beta hydrolase [Xylophilus sp. GW821-FHT01B05]